MFFDRKLFQKTLFVLSALALLSFVLRIYTYWVEIENLMGFFQTTPFACYLFNVIGFLTFGLCFLLSFRKTTSPKVKKIPHENMIDAEEDPHSTLLSEKFVISEKKNPPSENDLSAFSAQTASWQGTFTAFATFFPGFSFLFYSYSCLWNPEQNQNTYVWLYAILSALSGLYFIFTGIQNSKKKQVGRAFFALVPALWCTVRMVVEYRDLARFVNQTLYIGQFLFIISALFFFLYQAQLLLGEKPLTRPNSYAFTGLCVIFFGITARLSQLAAVVGDRMSADLVDISALLIDLAITLYVIVKIVFILKEDSDIF